MSRRNLMYDVAAMVIHRQTCYVDDLVPLFPSKSKHQIQKALHNAGNRGLIHCVRRGRNAYWTQGSKDLPAPPKPKPKREVRARNSVFDLGGVLLPEWTGTRLSPLGGWDE